MLNFRQTTVVVCLSLLCLLSQGCLGTTWTSKDQQVLVIKDPPKFYTIERPEALEEIKIYPLDEPGVVAGIKRKDIDALWKNYLKVFKWGLINESTLEEINKQAQQLQDEIDKQKTKDSE